jgi:lysyl-tRNA synthetase, class II
MTTELAEIQRRRAKLEAMRARGVDPFPHLDGEHRSLIAEIVSTQRDQHTERGSTDSTVYRLSGRVVGRRKHRETILLTLQDRTGTIRLRVSAATSAGKIADCDIGDIVAVSGRAYVTSRGERCLQVESGSLLAKAVRRPPEMHHLGEAHAGNRRELELIACPDRRALFAVRAALIAALREGLEAEAFIEVETPMLQLLAGGALARPFLTYHNTLRREVSLRIATELFLQRCIVGGLERVYELGKCFRNEGISRKHSPEFAMLEWSMAYCEYHAAAELIEGLVAYAVERAVGSLHVTYNGMPINLETPWRRVTLQDAIQERTGVDIFECDHDEIVAALPGSPPASISWSDAVLGLYGDCVEPSLIQPTIVYDFPLETHPCMKRHPVRPQAGESFDIVIGGVEICSGGTGLNNPDEQWERFVAQRGDAEGQQEPHPHDREYVAALEYGMPPVAGGGLGLDRLLMVLLDRESILDVILFPATR